MTESEKQDRIVELIGELFYLDQMVHREEVQEEEVQPKVDKIRKELEYLRR